MYFEIDKYQINHFSDKKDVNRAIIMLRSGDNQMGATIYFVAGRDELRSPTFTNGGNFSRVYFDFDLLAVFIDMLRNEKPIYCANIHHVMLPYVSVSTRAEPIGEGE